MRIVFTKTKKKIIWSSIGFTALLSPYRAPLITTGCASNPTTTLIEGFDNVVLFFVFVFFVTRDIHWRWHLPSIILTGSFHIYIDMFPWIFIVDILETRLPQVLFVSLIITILTLENVWISCLSKLRKGKRIKKCSRLINKLRLNSILFIFQGHFNLNFFAVYLLLQYTSREAIARPKSNPLTKPSPDRS